MEIDRKNSSVSSEEMKVDKRNIDYLGENYKVNSIFCPST